MLFGAVFTENSYISEATRCHEKTHVEQYQTFLTLGLALAVAAMFVFFAVNICSWWMFLLILIPLLGYYVWYGMEYLVRFISALIKYKFKNIAECNTKAYKSISLEREARDLQYEYQKVCSERKSAYSFSFIKYLKR